VRRRVRRLGVTPLGWWLLLVVWLLAAAAIPLVAVVLTARAEEPEDGVIAPAAAIAPEALAPERSAPATRGNRPAALERSEVVDLVAAHFPPEEVASALAVLACESRFDPRATGRAGERGLFQIHPVYWTWLARQLVGPDADLYDPDTNVAVAAAVWRQFGWAPWSCRPW
jgi:soluble lytic murein transglycosylase-like protein